VLLRNGKPGGNPTRRMHRLHGMRGGLPGSRDLCGRRPSCGIHERHRVQCRRVQQDQGLRRRGNHSPQRCAAYRERAKKSSRLLSESGTQEPEIRIRKAATQEIFLFSCVRDLMIDYRHWILSHFSVCLPSWFIVLNLRRCPRFFAVPSQFYLLSCKFLSSIPAFLTLF